MQVVKQVIIYAGIGETVQYENTTDEPIQLIVRRECRTYRDPDPKPSYDYPNIEKDMSGRDLEQEHFGCGRRWS